MAVTAWVPTKTMANLLGGETGGEAKKVDWLSDSHKLALVQSAWAPDRDTVESYADITNEVANGNGYTTGGKALTTPGLTVDAANNRVKLSSDSPVEWAAPSSFTARYAVLYDDTPGTAADKVILVVIDFGADEECINGYFRVTIPALGWFYADAA